MIKGEICGIRLESRGPLIIRSNLQMFRITSNSITDWISIITNQSPFTFKDKNTMPQRLYRARAVP